MILTIILSVIVFVMTNFAGGVHEATALSGTARTLAIVAIVISVAAYVLSLVFKKKLEGILGGTVGELAQIPGIVLSVIAVMLFVKGEFAVQAPTVVFANTFDVTKVETPGPIEITLKSSEETPEEEKPEPVDYSEVYRLIEEEKYDEALTKADEIMYATNRGPTDEYYYALIDANLAKGSTYWVPSYYNSIKNRDKTWYDGYLEFIYTRSADDYLKEAINAAWKYPDDYLMQFRVAMAMARNKNYEAAAYFFERAAAAGDVKVPVHYMYGASAYILGDFETAKAEFKIVRDRLSEIEDEETRTAIAEDLDRAEADMEGR